MSCPYQLKAKLLTGNPFGEIAPVVTGIAVWTAGARRVSPGKRCQEPLVRRPAAAHGERTIMVPDTFFLPIQFFGFSAFDPHPRPSPNMRERGDSSFPFFRR